MIAQDETEIDSNINRIIFVKKLAWSISRTAESSTEPFKEPPFAFNVMDTYLYPLIIIKFWPDSNRTFAF